MTSPKRTFLDASVLIEAWRGPEGSPAWRILQEPGRVFVSSALVRLETLPYAVYNQNADEKQFYLHFFEEIVSELSPADDALVADAHSLVCEFGTAPIDSLHLAAAQRLEADEFVTTEKRSSRLHAIPFVAHLDDVAG